MKSNKQVFVQYVYFHGQSFSLNETTQNLIDDHKAKMDEIYALWIEDDSWMELPKDEFIITTMNFDKEGNLSTLQFCEESMVRVG